MNVLKSFALVLVLFLPAHATDCQSGLEPIPPRPAAQPFPATSPICRVVAYSGSEQFKGTGTLVGETLVLTNWHVVTARQGEAPVTRVEVHFPGGFTSQANVDCTDAEWDLAALVIAPPPVAPLAIAEQPPQTGEMLTLAGYGRDGTLRQQSGELVWCQAPSPSAPNEMVAFRASADNGDSGGPILNRLGQLAGVTFGARDGYTWGTHCGRVRAFLGRCRERWRASPARALPRTQPLPPVAANAPTQTQPPAAQPPAPTFERPSPELQRLQDAHDKLLAERDALERRAADAEAILPQLDGTRAQLEACGKERLALEGRLEQVSAELAALKQAGPPANANGPAVCVVPPTGPPAGVAAPAAAADASSEASPLEAILSKEAAALVTGALVSFGMPAGLAGLAGGGLVWLVMRGGKKRLAAAKQQLEEKLGTSVPPTVVQAGDIERTKLAIQRVPVTNGDFNWLVEAVRRELAYNAKLLPFVTRIWSTFEQLRSGSPAQQAYTDSTQPGKKLGWQDPPPKE
jgi:hypothetical protein